MTSTTATAVDIKAENAAKFQQMLIERNISEAKLSQLVARYVSRIHISPRNCVIAASNLRKELKRDRMSDAFLKKATEILDLDKVPALSTADGA